MKKKGFTLIEIMIVVGILGMIVIPLTQLFRTFMRSWWQSRTKLTTQGEAREAAYWIIKEFKGSRRTTLGSLIANGGFEFGAEDNVFFWDISDSSGASHNTSSDITSTSTVRSGDDSIKIEGKAEETWSENPIQSELFSVTFSTSYFLSLNVRVDSGTIRCRLYQDIIWVGGWELTVTNDPVGDPDWISTWTVIPNLNIGNDYSIAFIYDIDNPDGSIYIDDISFTPLAWTMIDNTGSIVPQCSTFNYTSQVGGGGATEGQLHSINVVERTTSDGGTVNQLVRKELRSFVFQTIGNDYSDIYDSANWNILGFNRLAENVTFLRFAYDSISLRNLGKDGASLMIDITFEGETPEGETQEFVVTTRVYPLTP